MSANLVYIWVTMNAIKRVGFGVLVVGLLFALSFALVSCGGKGEEVTLEEAQSQRAENRSEMLSGTVERHGPPEYTLGTVGGTWVSSINNDPKTFNELNARDGDTGTVIAGLSDALADYDPYKKEWIPNLCDFEIEADEAADSMRVIFTLRDDLYWTLPGMQTREEGVKVTSDDVIFWYDEIEGDPELQQPGYVGQFIELADGSDARVTIEKIDERRFAFVYPRIVANPLLSSNMGFGPRYLYEAAKKERGVEGVMNLFAVDSDVTQIPSLGVYHIIEYTPGVRVVLQRNPHYWKTDAAGTSLPYMEQVIMRIVPDRNTELLLFKDGTKDSYSVRPEDLDELLAAENRDYTIYDGGETFGTSWIVFNQNQANVDEVVNSWFVRTQFRQAMSSLLNRERIAQQVYRGLASPSLYFFPAINPMYNPDIELEYTFNRERALALLSEIGMKRDDTGVMRDAAGNAVEFDIIMGAESNLGIDIANVFADELNEVGITLNVRPIDFQKLVESLTATYDWEVMLFGGWAQPWPSSGSNVWQSNGNFHLWYPLQNEPVTGWEARLDYLYNEGRFTLDRDERLALYDEFQRIILTELPVLFIVHPLSFAAVRDKWQNVFYDTLGGLDSTYLYLEP